jgi:ATP-binding cassette subfamily B protein
MSFSEFSIRLPFTSDMRSERQWLLSHIRRHWVQVLALLVGAFANAYLASVIPLLLRMAYQAVYQKHPINYTQLLWVAGMLIASQAGRAVLQLMRNFSAEVIGQRLERDARTELYTSLLGQSMAYHDSIPVGDTMARATNDVREVNLLLNPGVNLVVGSAMFLLMPPIMALQIHPALAIMPCIFIVLYIFAVKQHLESLRPISEAVRESFGQMNSTLAEAIDGIETVKGMVQERREGERFAKKARQVREALVRQGVLEARYIPLLLLGLAMAIGFWHATWLYQHQQLEIGDIVAYTGLISLFGFPVNISINAYTQVSLGMAGARRILQVLTQKTAMDENANGYQAEMKGNITFAGVDFGYAEQTNTLHDINLQVNAGETVAIVGQTGAGKTTLVKLVNRIYDTTRGQVLLDGVDVRDWQLAVLRRQVSIIEQDIFLFSRTIAENIAFGLPNATAEQIVWAAREAQAEEFILSFKDGFQTVVGERGVTLSGGQRQRIALARAFLANPRILILDDSTSAIDSATEDHIQRAIRRASKRQTTLLITHRISQIRWADKIVVLRGGRIEAVGTHQHLMETSPAYQKIFHQAAE